MAAALKECKQFVEEHARRWWPVLVLANKQEQPGALTVTQVRKLLRFSPVKEPLAYNVMGCTAGPAANQKQQGIEPALEWLRTAMQDRD